MHIAVIGAGVAGLACARRLLEGDHTVTVFERDDRPGGRVATMRTEIGGFDHGAQYVTARHPEFERQVDAWSRAGAVAPWPVLVHSLEAVSGHAAVREPSTGRTLRWVGVPGMSAITTLMAEGIDIRYGAWIVSVDAVSGQTPRWSLQRREQGGDERAITEGIFDTVVVALPAESAAVLLEPVSALLQQTTQAHVEPCWALMIGFAEPIAADLQRVGDAAFVNGGRLAWIARESSKPERRPGERWTLHAQSAWSVEHLDDDPEDVKTKMLKAFHEATGTNEQPIYAMVHRWRHALARRSLASDFLWDAGRRVGVCGDWCRGYRVEDAWLSGVALARTVASAG
ncbi:MAG: FAD-dependent oxidoreductase [Burkholderiaceae bacterium]